MSIQCITFNIVMIVGTIALIITVFKEPGGESQASCQITGVCREWDIAICSIMHMGCPYIGAIYIHYNILGLVRMMSHNSMGLTI